MINKKRRILFVGRSLGLLLGRTAVSSKHEGGGVIGRKGRVKLVGFGREFAGPSRVFVRVGQQKGGSHAVRAS